MLNFKSNLLTHECTPSLLEAPQDERCLLTDLYSDINGCTKDGKELLRDIQNHRSCN